MTNASKAQAAGDDRLAEIEALCEAATPGPWKAEDGSDGFTVYRDFTGYPPEPIAIASTIYPECVIGLDDDDARFIAAAREAVPMLIAALRESREREAHEAELRVGHPAMCCGQCIEEIRKAEATTERVRWALRLVLPLAKSHAFASAIKSNYEIVADAEEIALKETQP